MPSNLLETHLYDLLLIIKIGVEIIQLLFFIALNHKKLIIKRALSTF